jgi:hypothetical protein
MTNTLRHKQVPFVQISRPLLQDTRISFKAKGLMAWMCDKPDGWKFNIEGIASQSKEHKDAIETGLRELQKYGYLTITKKKDDQGRFTGCDWELDQIPPISNNISVTGLSGSGKSGTGISGDGETPTSNTHISSLEEDIEKHSIVCCPSTIKKFNNKKEEIEINQEDIFRLSVMKRQDWKTLEIQEAWETLVNYDGPVNDYYAFIEGVIKNKRKLITSENIIKKETTWKNQPRYPQAKNSETSNPSKKQQDTTNDSTSTTDQSGGHLARLASQLGLK